MADTVFDTIIVGAGTAGCLLAKRLTEDGKKRVLLLEAGGKDNYIWIHIPVGYLYCIGNPRTDWLYQTEPAKGLNGRTMRYPRGKVLGGCSSINGMLYLRGQERDYDNWARLTGEDEWRWDVCLQDFMSHEDNWRLDDDAIRSEQAAGKDVDAIRRFHHHGGEWRVSKQRLHWDILDAFRDAAVQAGIPAIDDFNRGNNEGIGYFDVNQKDGWRWNTSKAFLRDCEQRSNLTVWTQAQVAKLLLERTDAGLRCNGAEVWMPSGKTGARLAEGGELLLTAGSIGSPQILQLSGVGPAALLKQYGIDVVADVPGVGANLQDHLQIRAVYKVKHARTLNQIASTPWGKASIGLEYLLKRTGPMSMAPSQLGAFTKSSPELEWPDLEYHVQPLSLDAFGEPLHKFPAITASVCNIKPTSRGTVNIQSPDFKQAPAIAPNYLSTDNDLLVAANSLRLTRRIMAQAAFKKYEPEEYLPGVQYQTDAELAKLAGDIGSTIFHPVGTTKMGGDGDATAVLDGRFRARDGQGGFIGGLRVVNAGAMPVITSGNTNSPTLMMAEKAARWILAAA